MSKKDIKKTLNRIINKGKEKWSLTYEEVNDILDEDDLSPEQIDDLMIMLGETDIDIVDGTSKDQRRSISENYIDSEGSEQSRGGGVDFSTLPFRHLEVVYNLEGFNEDEVLGEWMRYARIYYDRGEHDKALQYLNWLMKKMPSLEPYIFYYVKVCERVLSIPLKKEEIEYEVKLTRYRALPKWLRWIIFGFIFKLRCKWCGRYTQYIDPNVPTLGLDSFPNSCEHCGHSYPMPSWMWDSPDGRAYSFYRQSFSDEDFYREFERDYDPE